VNQDPDIPKFHVSPAGWKVLGAAGITFGAVCFVGIVAVVALKKGDALASIALVLAIGAFIVQIVVSALQNSASRAAEAASRGLNFETNKVLEQIKASAAANQEILARQFDTLLDALVKGRTSSELGQKSESDESTAPDRERPIDLREFVPRFIGPSEEDQRIIEMLRTFPDEEEAKPLLDRLERLPANAVAMLDRYARDELKSRKMGAVPGLTATDSPVPNSARKKLLDEDLLSDHGDGYYGLTDQGLQLARLLKGRDAPPPNVAAALGVEAS
jgi:hypothetical protein